MRLTLENFLKIEGQNMSKLARQINKTRETIRQWRAKTDLTIVVVVDPVTLNVRQVEISKMRVFKGEAE